MSNRTRVIPNENIEILGTGNDRVLRITPIADQVGLASLTLTLDDGRHGDVSREFQLDLQVIKDFPGTPLNAGDYAALKALSEAIPGLGWDVSSAEPPDVSIVASWDGVEVRV